MVAEEVGAAPYHRGGSRRDLGGNRPGAAGQRQRRPAGERHHGAARQHGQRSADPRAQRQRTVIGRGAGHDPAVGSRRGAAHGTGDQVARPSAPGQQAGPRHRIQPRQDKKRQLYRDLVAATQASRAELQAMAEGLAAIAETAVVRWRAEVDHYLALIARVISQTRRRVFDGQTVPAGEKLVSLFEPHADILVKGGRQQERADPRCRH